MKSARAAGLAVFYVSNRDCVQAPDCKAEEHTIQNLTSLGFPDVTADKVLLLNEKPEWTSDKTSRRKYLADQGYQIVMLIGDDLKDFLPARMVARVRAGLNETERDIIENEVDYLLTNFGRRWFMLPNPMYGSWDRELPATVEERQSLLNTPKGWGAAPSSVQSLMQQPHPLKVITWNVAWLANEPLDEAEVAKCNEESKISDMESRPTPECRKGRPFRKAGSYVLLAKHAKALDGDIIGLQEVEGLQAVERLFDGRLPSGVNPSLAIAPDTYYLAVNPKGGWQRVGIAIKKSILEPGSTPSAEPFTKLGEPLTRDKRSGLEVKMILADGKPLTVLVVHLKSRCTTDPLDSSTNPNCPELRKQAPILAGWIADKESARERYMIIGDFNRNLSEEPSNKLHLTGWLESGNGSLVIPPIIAPTAKLSHSSGCVDPQYDSDAIEHIVLGGGAEQGYVDGSVVSTPYIDNQTGQPIRDHSKTRFLSDHCAVGIQWQP